MFADAYASFGALLLENASVLLLGTVIAGPDGARIHARECYPLEGAVAALIRKVTWLLDPAAADVVAFLRQLRETVNAQPGDTRTEFAFVFPDRATPVAEASPALGWRLNPTAFHALRAHPAVCGAHFETRRLEFKQDRRWSRR
jgi:DNA polymerase-3 subunit alpha